MNLSDDDEVTLELTNDQVPTLAPIRRVGPIRDGSPGQTVFTPGTTQARVRLRA